MPPHYPLDKSQCHCHLGCVLCLPLQFHFLLSLPLSSTDEPPDILNVCVLLKCFMLSCHHAFTGVTLTVKSNHCFPDFSNSYALVWVSLLSKIFPDFKIWIQSSDSIWYFPCPTLERLSLLNFLSPLPHYKFQEDKHHVNLLNWINLTYNIT